MNLKVKCNICNQSKIVNGQKQFDTWKTEHKHLDKQTEIEYKTGVQFDFEYLGIVK